MSNGTAITLQPAGTPHVKILKKDLNKKSHTCVRRFVYIWIDEGGKWKAEGLFLTDKNGILYNVEDDVRMEYKNSQKSNSDSKPEKKNMYLLSKGPSEKTPDPSKHSKFKPKPKKDYFLAFLPVDLLLDKSFTSNHTNIKTWAQNNAILLDKPPSHWLQRPEDNGVLTKITNEILATGLTLPKNWLEWLWEIRQILDKMNWYSAYATARKQPYLQATILLDTIGELLEVTSNHADKEEQSQFSYVQSRNYGLYQLEKFSSLIKSKYLTREELQKEEMAYMRFSQQVLDIINNSDFKKSFLQFAVVDRKCDGSSGFSLETQRNTEISFDPVHFIQQNRIDQIIRAAFAAILYEPHEIITKHFYESTILPAELKLADTLGQDELSVIKSIFSDQEFSAQYLSGCTNTQKKAFLTEVDNVLKPLTDVNALAILSKENPILKKAIEDADNGNPVWNWIKDSAQDNIDEFLGIFSTMRETWATEDFGKSPTLSNSWRNSTRRSLVSLRILSSSYKRYKAHDMPGSKIAIRSAKNYLLSVKDRMLDKGRWLKNNDGDSLKSTPANLCMIFSAIGVVVSIQGIYSFAQKCKGGNKPEIDDYIDLYKTLSSGASSLIGLMPDALSDSQLVKALGTVFKPLSAACDIHASIKLIKKSQIYYAHRDLGKSLYSGIEAGIKLSNAGFTLATLFRTKWIAKYLLKRESLLAAGSKTLSYSLSFALIGCELFKWYLKSIEPEASKFTKEKIVPLLDDLISVPPKRGETKLETVKVEVHGTSFNVPKINNYDPALMWEDSREYRGKEIYCDPNRKWDWVALRSLINDEMTGVAPLKGLGWIKEFDENKAMFDLLDRGVSIEAVAAVCKRKKEEVENLYKIEFSNRMKRLENKQISKIDKEKNIVLLLS